MNGKPAHELHTLLINKKISSSELTEKIFDRINAVEGKVQAYVTLTKEEAIKQARAADERIKQNKDITPLTG
ncbi:MAG: amidase family protein, partial [Candidatus Margulisiibacteriota bacterium]